MISWQSFGHVTCLHFLCRKKKKEIILFSVEKAVKEKKRKWEDKEMNIWMGREAYTRRQNKKQ